MKKIGIVLSFCLISFLTVAQEFSYGFRVGLNFSTLMADSEMDASGNSLETFDYNTGFHVGAAFIYKITDLVGVRAELLYNQKGLQYKYDGAGFQIFTDDANNRILSSDGNRRYFVEVSNSYIDIPITAYYKFGERVEVFGGFHASVLVSSTGVGEFSYAGDIPGFPSIDETFELDFRYFGDTPLFPGGVSDNVETVDISNNNRTISIPRQLGAYDLDYLEKDGSFYNFFDLGLTGGLALYINSGLFVSGTVNYGLLDATNDFYDISRVETNGLEYISRNDKDTNFSIMTSIGFAF